MSTDITCGRCGFPMIRDRNNEWTCEKCNGAPAMSAHDAATPRPWLYALRLLWRDTGKVIPEELLKLPDITGWVEGALNGDPEAEANAALIVIAVNNHAALVAALRDMLTVVIDSGAAEAFIELDGPVADARRVLAAAEEPRR